MVCLSSVAACSDGDSATQPVAGESATTSEVVTTTTRSSVELPVFEDDPCEDAPDPMAGDYAELFTRWADQEAAAPMEPGRVVVTGSSSVRMWSSLQEEFSAWSPVQRGFGGALLWDVAGAADLLIGAHDPSGVVLFAGANDLAEGASAEETFDAYRCVLQRIRDGVGDIPVAMITVTPTPLRWDIWPVAEEFHQLVIELSDEWSGLHVVDGREAYLATGEPPDDDLFLGDLLHLSPSGYALWDEQAHAALDEVLTSEVPAETTVSAGRYVVDFGSTTDAVATEPRTVVPMHPEGGLIAGEQWRLADDGGQPGPRLVVADWNLTPTPDGQGIYVRPSPFAHVTLEGVEPGAEVRVTVRPVDPEGAAPLAHAIADSHGRAHLHLLDQDGTTIEVAGLEITVGG